jgi:phospholipid/cholesterol/gamma-HCH transport system ATP-binding protein
MNASNSENTAKTGPESDAGIPDGAPAIEFRDVSLWFDKQQVLDGVSFIVTRGETLILMSKSGGGKSTILRVILGLTRPDSGRILICGEDITDYDEEQLDRVREKIGMDFQEGALFDSISVYDNVAFRLHEWEVPEEEVDGEVRRLLRFVDMEDAIDQMPAQLSGGMKTRVAIARALAGEPEIVLFDEPTAGLDPPTARTICELIIKLRDIKDVASVLVTHAIDALKQLITEHAALDAEGRVEIEERDVRASAADTRILFLDEGRVIFDDTGQKLLESKHPVIVEFLLDLHI